MKTHNPIIFYNHYHNGDLLNSKAFVSEIMEKMPIQFLYAHNKSEKILKDLGLTQIRLEHIFPITENDPKVKMIVAPNVTLVNTWIGAYFEPEGECTLRFSYNMYKKVYAQINEIYGTDLKLKDNPVEYFPSIDFTVFDLEKTDSFLRRVGRGRKVLISNGPAMSGQCSYNDDMKEIIERIADEHPDILFIATHKFGTDKQNIHFTQDIIGASECDLNEISYISNHCEMIVGRSSGPFSFSCTKMNVNNLFKTFLCFGDRITDCFHYGTETKSNFVFEKFTTTDNLYSAIKKELND